MVEQTLSSHSLLPKAPTGIQGLDEITEGGLPKGRPTLVCGTAGSGKTLLAMEFLVRGVTQYNEPGVFVAFEETRDDLIANVASLGFDLKELVTQRKMALDHIYIDPTQIEETGEYDLEGLFVRLGYAIDSIGAKRVVLDTIETLFGALSNTYVVRSELNRLFRWLKSKGVTAIITAERGEGTLTRHGMEEYVSDCVILLDHRVNDQVSTRRLRIVKYRGSAHGTNEYPFLIDRTGFVVLPVTSLGLDHEASMERISTGIPQLDELLEGQGFFRGSSILISGTAGSGKTSSAIHFAYESCRLGERCLYIASEESRSQIVRNMRSIGKDVEPYIERGTLVFHNIRPTLYSLEMHLAKVHQLVNEFNPTVVIFDPITNFTSVGSRGEINAMLLRLIDFLKGRQITTMLLSLTNGGQNLEQTDVNISSLIDTWLLLRDVESNGERNRLMYILKSRGMAHSNQVREFLLTKRGIELREVYLGTDGVLTGSARVAQEARERAAQRLREQEIEQLELSLERKRKVLEAQIAALQANFEAESKEQQRVIEQQRIQYQYRFEDQAQMAQSRKADIRQRNGDSPHASGEEPKS